MKVITRIVLASALAALVLAADAAGGGFATVQLSSTPAGTDAGQPWSVDLTVLQHGRTPLDGMEPLITIANGADETSFPATPTGEPGVYHADVVFPEAGTWEWKIWDGFSQTHTYAAVEIPQAGSPIGGSSDGISVWLVALAGAAVAGARRGDGRHDLATSLAAIHRVALRADATGIRRRGFRSRAEIPEGVACGPLAGVSGHSLAEGAQHLLRDRRRVPDQLREGSVGEHEHAGLRRRRDRRGARDVGDEGDLADPVARAELTDGAPLADDLHRAALDHEELSAALALTHERLVGGDVELVGDDGDVPELALRQPREQRHVGEELDLAVLAQHRPDPTT